MRLRLPDTAATEALGALLADTLPAQAALHLQGDLGAGKSTLARALLRRLGVQGAIRSPTYTLVERYPISGGEAWHLDLYRIGDVGELDFLGLDDAAVTLWLVEWPDRAGQALPVPELRVHLGMEGGGRMVELVPETERGRHWLTRLAETPGFAALSS